MLLRRPTLDAIASGQITLVFRRWRRPTVKTGGRLRTSVGELSIDAVDAIEDNKVTNGDARAAGYADRAALLADLAGRDDQLYRIRVHLAGPDARIARREQAELTAADLQHLDERLARLDKASRHGAWTATTLRLIAERPATRAPDLAASLGRDTQPFKTDVRKLKELGLTESLEIGYRLSPRGRTYLEHLSGSDEPES
jgi:hypothetical protein